MCIRDRYYIGCIEEVAFRRGFINAKALYSLGKTMGKTDYGRYLIAVAEEGLSSSAEKIDHFLNSQSL